MATRFDFSTQTAKRAIFSPYRRRPVSTPSAKSARHNGRGPRPSPGWRFTDAGRDLGFVLWCALRIGLPMCLLAIVAPVVAQTAAPITARDDRGIEISFAASPQRIISLLPSATESVCALGACSRLVGTDQFSNTPPEVRALPKLGGLDDAQVERIVSLKPDVVLATKSARVIERLESLGVKVIVLESNSHADVKRTLKLLARLLDAPDQADRVWSQIERETQLAASRVPQALRGKNVYFEVAADPYAAGTNSFIGETLTRLGMGNIAPPELGPFPKLNPEFIVRARPDIIMAADRQVKQMASRPGWQGLSALQGRSCGFATERYELLIRPGPRMGEAALAIADCLVGLRAPTTQ